MGGNGQVGEAACRILPGTGLFRFVSDVRADEETAVNPDLNVLALFKGTERFIFVYDDDSRDELFRALRDAAADPAVALNWFDASVLTERARSQTAGEPDSDSSSRLPTTRQP